MKIKKYGFTLAEVLIAMVIIGIIAALTVPILLSSIFDRAYVNHAKNMVGTIEQLAADELVNHKTRFLSSTDFSNPANLLVQSHFEFSEVCNGDCATPDGGYNTIASHDGAQENPFGETLTLRLKSGAMITYTIAEAEGEGEGEGEGAADNNNPYGTFTFDVNGTDKPNTIGRDIFSIQVDVFGHIIPPAGATFAACRDGDALACTGVIMNNAWRIPDELRN